MTKYLIFLILVAVSVQGTTYYVKTDGSDAADGLSKETAFQTTGKVQTVMSEGDTAEYDPGKYYGHIEPPNGIFSDRTCYTCSDQVSWPPACTVSAAQQFGDSTWTQSGLGANIYYTSAVPPHTFTADLTGGGDLYDESWTLGIDDSLQDLACTSSDEPTCQGMDSSDVDAAGEFYWDASEEVLYVWAYDSRDMSSSAGEVEMPWVPVVWINSASEGNYCTFSWLTIEYGNRKTFFINGHATNVGPDSLFVENCKIGYAGHVAAKNCSAIGSASNSTDSSNNAKYFRLYGCELHNVADASNGANHELGFIAYNLSYSTIDSCWCGESSEIGGFISFKGVTNGPIQAGNVMQNNVITNFNAEAILLLQWHSQDTIRNNYILFNGIGTNGITIDDYQPQNDHLIHNNTIIQEAGDKGILFTNNGGQRHRSPNYIYGNLTYLTGSGRAVYIVDSAVVDSVTFGSTSACNLYYAAAGEPQFQTGGTQVSLATWRGAPFNQDVDSVITVDPGFTSLDINETDPDVIRVDLARLSASNEMSFLGRTICGAWAAPSNGGTSASGGTIASGKVIISNE